jgi:hypothetical protein
MNFLHNRLGESHAHPYVRPQSRQAARIGLTEAAYGQFRTCQVKLWKFGPSTQLLASSHIDTDFHTSILFNILTLLFSAFFIEAPQIRVDVLRNPESLSCVFSID